MKTILFMLTFLISLSSFGQKVYTSDSFMELLGKEIEMATKFDRVEKYWFKMGRVLNDLDKETAVIRLKHKSENLIVYASIKRDKSGKMYYVIKDIAKVHLDKNEEISVCLINNEKEVVGIFSTEKNEISKLEKVWKFDNKEMKLKEFDLDNVETIDEMQVMI